MGHNQASLRERRAEGDDEVTTAVSKERYPRTRLICRKTRQSSISEGIPVFIEVFS